MIAPLLEFRLEPVYGVIIIYYITTKNKNVRNKRGKKSIICHRRKKSGCILNLKLPFLKLNTGNLDLPAQTLTG